MGDLHVVDIVAVPQRFHHGVGKAEHQYILYRALAQIVIDAEHLVLAQVPADPTLQRLGALQVVTEGFLYHHPFPAVVFLQQLHRMQVVHHGGKFRGTDRHVKSDVGRQRGVTGETLSQAPVHLRIAKVAPEIVDACGKALEGGSIERSPGLGGDPFADLSDALLPFPGAPAQRQDTAALRQFLRQLQMIKSGHQLDPRKVAGGTENNVAAGLAHALPLRVDKQAAAGGWRLPGDPL